ncbi:CoA pyrophosphatase [Plasticicumulans acidivorans]|uniref:NUDIX domain-containing protein n=1 Tax=Plasticicumulans acidivorans TaxID=886464 RepID=A0A317MSM3_9GAMM|nr:CoA pyrophosphatase [Plasticicumulans acidivorans]PWV59550.1 NUDIX domain-containing protein [Plasticicumulans acidivorans]
MKPIPATLDLIRERVATRPDPRALSGDHAVAGLPREDRPLTPAAVLVPLVLRAEGLTVLLTQRTEHLSHHPGQISFPGGRCEAEDVDPIATALRETEEEIGLARSHVEIAGYLDLYQTVTGFLVTPVVAFIEPQFELTLDAFEVADAFEVPLAFILDPANHSRGSRVLGGRERFFYVLAYGERYIWGATAAMLINLSQKLAG